MSDLPVNNCKITFLSTCFYSFVIAFIYLQKIVNRKFWTFLPKMKSFADAGDKLKADGCVHTLLHHTEPYHEVGREKVSNQSCTVADPGFPRGGGANPKGEGTNLLFG